MNGILGCIKWMWLGCIYSHQPIPSHCHLFAACERYALLVQTIYPCKINEWITTVGYNGYINDYNRIKCVIRCQIKPDTDGPTVPLDDPREHLKFIFLNPTPSGFSGFQWVDGPYIMPDGIYLSFGWSIVGMYILHSSYLKSSRCRG
jgi:hypothetical protein